MHFVLLTIDEGSPHWWEVSLYLVLEKVLYLIKRGRKEAREDDKNHSW